MLSLRLFRKYPNGQHFEEAKDLLGAVNIDILFSPRTFSRKTKNTS